MKFDARYLVDVGFGRSKFLNSVFDFRRERRRLLKLLRFGFFVGGLRVDVMLASDELLDKALVTEFVLISIGVLVSSPFSKVGVVFFAFSS